MLSEDRRSGLRGRCGVLTGSLNRREEQRLTLPDAAHADPAGVALTSSRMRTHPRQEASRTPGGYAMRSAAATRPSIDPSRRSPSSAYGPRHYGRLHKRSPRAGRRPLGDIILRATQALRGPGDFVPNLVPNRGNPLRLSAPRSTQHTREQARAACPTDLLIRGSQVRILPGASGTLGALLSVCGEVRVEARRRTRSGPPGRGALRDRRRRRPVPG